MCITSDLIIPLTGIYSQKKLYKCTEVEVCVCKRERERETSHHIYINHHIYDVYYNIVYSSKD